MTEPSPFRFQSEIKYQAVPSTPIQVMKGARMDYEVRLQSEKNGKAARLVDTRGNRTEPLKPGQWYRFECTVNEHEARLSAKRLRWRPFVTRVLSRLRLRRSRVRIG